VELLTAGRLAVGTAPVSRPRILVVATIGRSDILAMFGRLRERAELSFLEFTSTPGLTPALYEPYGQLATWEEHHSARSLLRSLQPDLLVMLGIGARNQLALRCEARRRSVRVVHLEHGYRLPVTMRRSLNETRRGTEGDARERPRSTLATHRFFAATLATLPPRQAARLLRYALPSVGGASVETMAGIADLRRADRYVSFAPECFEFHRELDRIPPDLAERAVYVGVPQFDCFRAGADTVEADSGTVVLVDHQLHNAGILGWDRPFHRRWAAGIHEAVVASGRRLVVKAHPGDTASPWSGYTDGSVEIVPSIELLERRARSSRLALGVMSTLQLPLAGLDHMAMVTVEIHPQPGEVLSARLVEAGVTQPVASFEALAAALDDTAALHERQLPHKAAFVEHFLHRLDGGASERLAEAVLAEAAPNGRGA
jgi:hypothetical protein